MKHRTTICAVTGLAAVIPAYAAQDNTALSEESFFNLQIPVVLSATRLSQPHSEVPGSLSVISREMIEASGRRSIVDLLRLVPGFQVGHDTFRPAATYHGFSDKYANRLQVLIDGRSVYTPVFGGVDWNDLPLSVEDIEKIEVFRGPNAVTYGANSFIAVVNIITRHPSTLSGKLVKIEGGENAYGRLYARITDSQDTFKYRMSVDSSTEESFPLTPYEKPRTRVNFRSDYVLDGDDSLEFNFGLVDGTHETGSQGSTVSPFREKDIQANFQQIRWKHQFAADNELSLQYYRNYHKVDDVFDVAGSAYSLGTHMERNNLELQHTLAVGANSRLVWGAEARIDEVKSDPGIGWFGSADSMENKLVRTFANLEWRMTDSLLMNAGVMAEDNDISGSQTSPRLALNYHLDDQQTLRVVASRATRTPSFIEAYASSVIKIPAGPSVFDLPFNGNDQLLAENMKSIELGYFANLLQNRLQLDLRLFKENITDAIVAYAVELPPATSSIEMVNDGEAELQGAELAINYRPSNRTQLNLTWSRAEQEGQIRSVTISGVPFYANSNSTTPENTLSLLLSHQYDNGYSVSAGYYRVSGLSWIADSTVSPVLDSYDILDLRLARTLQIGDKKGQIELVVLDSAGEYSDYSPAQPQQPPVLDRMAYVSFGIAF